MWKISVFGDVWWHEDAVFGFLVICSGEHGAIRVFSVMYGGMRMRYLDVW